MKILYYDAFSGISGDMNLGAMIDIGVDKDYLINQLEKLDINDEYKIEVKKDSRKGIYGTKVNVILKNHAHDHDDVHAHHHHHHHHHHSRNLKDIENIILNSDLSENIKNISMKIFGRVAEAEGTVHNKPMDEVHFHEVGAIDSIIDIVGAAVCLDYLQVDKVMASTIELGGGFVKCQHGLIPVPAPATVEILKEIPVKSGAVPFETTTPTGAAILAAIVDEYTDNKKFNMKKIGYGIGGRDTEIPNVLRVIVGEKEELLVQNSSKNNQTQEDCYIMECNIDDMNPEIYEYVSNKLFDSGALDVFFTPIIMKKGRPGVKLSVLYKKQYETILQEIIFNETTSIGIRKYAVERSILERSFSKISTKFGEITIKHSYYNGKLIKSKPEYEDCKRLALLHDVSINEIYKEAEFINFKESQN